MLQEQNCCLKIGEVEKVVKQMFFPNYTVSVFLMFYLINRIQKYKTLAF